jgi:hypothetical protein
MQFALEKYLISVGLIIAFIAFLGVFVYAYYTEVSNPPLDTKTEAFQGFSKEVESTSIIQFDKDMPLSKAHVNSKEIQNWLNTSVSEALTFEGRDYLEVIKKVRLYFTPSGYKQYKDYLESADVIKTLESGSYRIGLFFDQNPYVGHGFNYENVYRWQAQMPLSLSFQSTKTGQFINRDINLSLQIRRVNNEEVPNGVQIESWQVRPRRK